VIVKALQDWRPYLADTEKSIQIYTDHKNLRNFATTKQLNQWQVCWAEQLAIMNFKSITRRVMRMMKQTLWVNSLIMKKWKRFTWNSEWRWQEILTKGLAAMYKVKQAFLTDEELIQVCHNSRVMNTLKSKELRTSYKEDTISVTLKIKSLSTLSDAIHVTETRFREIKDMTK
jgi:hypothetical protein